MFAGFFGAPPADGGLKTFGWRFPPIRRFSSGPAGLVVNRAADRRVMDAPRGGDRPDPPVLAEIEAPNLGALRGRDHRSVSLLYAERPTVPGSTTGWPGRRRGSGSDPARRPAGARVWRGGEEKGKCDPSRAAAPGRPGDGPDDRGDLPDCADGAPWRPVPGSRRRSLATFIGDDGSSLDRVEVGSGTQVRRLPTTYASRADAEAAATSWLSRDRATRDSVQVTTAFTPSAQILQPLRSQAPPSASLGGGRRSSSTVSNTPSAPPRRPPPPSERGPQLSPKRSPKGPSNTIFQGSKPV